MTDQQFMSEESGSHHRRKVFFLITFVAAGLGMCTAMKAFVCGKISKSLLSQGVSGEVDCGCPTSEED